MIAHPQTKPRIRDRLGSHRRRPWLVSLALLFSLSSVNYVSAAPPLKDNFEELTSRGPHDVLEFNAAGEIVAKAQKSADADLIAAEIANSLENGRTKGYFEVSDDFGVTLTPEGRQFAEDTIAESSAGCAKASSVAADWAGFHVKVEQSCSNEELQERLGIDIAEEPESAAVPTSVSAAGLALPVKSPRPPLAWVTSDDLNCWATLATVGAVIIAAFLVVVLAPWAGWFLFTLELAVGGLAFFSALIDAVQNCTQVLSARAQKRIWVGYYIYPTVQCSFAFYSNYRWSYSTGQSVPTYVRYNC